jgi:hypothetical protein
LESNGEEKNNGLDANPLVTAREAKNMQWFVAQVFQVFFLKLILVYMAKWVNEFSSNMSI